MTRFISLLVVFMLSISSAAIAESAPIKRILIAGDSTAADYPSARAPQIGWGQALPFFLKEDIEVINLAVNGRSTKSYIDEGLWSDLIGKAAAGDLVLISFGHNDARDDAPKRYAPAFGAYKDNLAGFAGDVKAAGGAPLVLSPASRRLWEGPAMVETHGLYREAAKAAAGEAEADFIDLSTLSLAYFEKLGREETKRDFIWVIRKHWKSGEMETLEDNTHFSYLGACGVASVIAQQLQLGPWGNVVRKDYAAPDPSAAAGRPEAVEECAAWIEGALSPVPEWRENY